MKNVAPRKRDKKETVEPYTGWADQHEKDTISADPTWN